MIVVGGEALVDLVPDKSTVDDSTEMAPLVPRLGGGPYNVALAAARLGARTSFLSRVSSDRFGEALVTRLHDSGVRTDLLQRGPQPTTLAVVSLDDQGGAAYSFYTEGTADRLVADPGPLPEEVSALSIGTLGMVLEPGASTYETLLQRESERGTLTMLDPNVRADLIEDVQAYRERFISWLPHVRLLKLSADEVEWLGGRDTERSIRHWLDAGVRAVVVTDGGKGLSVTTASGEKIAVDPVRVSVADTIGAGDTVQGALLAWMYHRQIADPDGLGAAGWREALGFAARAAAVTVSRAGAEPPTSAELDTFGA